MTAIERLAAADSRPLEQHGYTVGQRVLWRGGFGRDHEREATITGFGEEKQRIVVDLDNGHWAYLYQIRPLPSAPPAAPEAETGCTWVSGNEPCENCPRLVTALYMCKLLQDTAKP